MPKPSAISVFAAATSLLVASAPAVHAQSAGGLKEWNTDQDVSEESVLDSDAAALKKRQSKKIFVFPLEKARTAGDSILFFSKGATAPFFMPKKAPRRAPVHLFYEDQNLKVVLTRPPSLLAPSI